jgi:uncharacterized protein YegJ (DUF2314 family)
VKGQMIKYIFLIVAIIAMTATTGCDSVKQSTDPVVPVGTDDKEMNEAIQKAQTSLDGFIRRLEHPERDDKWFLVKGRFSCGDDVEHIWVANITYTGKAFSGVLANEPNMSCLHFKKAVNVPVEDISDWMYVSQNRLVGGFTTRVLYNRMSPKKRNEEDLTRPYRID